MLPCRLMLIMSPIITGNSNNNFHQNRNPTTSFLNLNSYSDKYDGTRELVNTNKKGFALLGLLSLMAVLVSIFTIRPKVTFSY